MGLETTPSAEAYRGVDNERAGTVFELLGDLKTDQFERFAGKGIDLFFFGNIKDDLYPFQMIGDGDAAGMVVSIRMRFLGFGRRHRHDRLLRAKRLKDDRIEHHLPRIYLLGPMAIEAPE
jgi:hypothetical protein